MDGDLDGGSPRSGSVGRGWLRLSWCAATATVALQITYPLLDGPGHAGALEAVTVASVLTFALASLAHAAATRGPRTALAVLLVAGGIGLAAEVLGVRTGIPFGTYSYPGTLGPALLTVPLVVPLAWVMMAWPCLLLGRRVAGRRAAGRRVAGRRAAGRRPGGRRPNRGSVPAVLLGAWTLAAWDVFLDPQMVAAGHWVFAADAPGLPGTSGVPLTNHAGWALVALVMIAALDRAVPVRAQPHPDQDLDQHEGMIAVLLGWTWLGSALANVAFFGRPAVAAWGGLAMGLPVALYLREYLRELWRPARPSRVEP